MAHDVFISYPAEDKITADAVCATLEAKEIRCWIAPRDILTAEAAASRCRAVAWLGRYPFLSRNLAD